jgi:hypothetical protein
MEALQANVSGPSRASQSLNGGKYRLVSHNYAGLRSDHLAGSGGMPADANRAGK